MAPFMSCLRVPENTQKTRRPVETRDHFCPTSHFYFPTVSCLAMSVPLTRIMELVRFNRPLTAPAANELPKPDEAHESCFGLGKRE